MPERRTPPVVQTLGGDDNSLLVRLEDEAMAMAAARSFLAREYAGQEYADYDFVIELKPARTYRWVPAPRGDDEFRYYLWPSEPGPGAFRAREAYWRHVRRDADDRAGSGR